MNNDCVIVIPIYKEHLENYEILSLHRLYQVLGHKYDIKYLTYEELNTLEYANIAYQYGYEYIDRIHFDKLFFIYGKLLYNVGYNMLFTTTELYLKFLDYEYMFIYHLDCYIFYDNLEYWMNLGLPQVECVLKFFDITGGITFYGGEGLRHTKTFYQYLSNNEMKVKQLILGNLYFYCYCNQSEGDDIRIEDLIFHYNEANDYSHPYWGEDTFFTKEISNFEFPLNITKFGVTLGTDIIYDIQEEIPMIVHWFLKELCREWSLLYIGDWENNLLECINNPIH